MRYLQVLKNEFLFNGHLQSIGAASITAFMGKVIGSANAYALAFFVYLLFLFIFQYDRYAHAERDCQTNSTRTQHIRLLGLFVVFSMVTQLWVSLLGIYVYGNLSAVVFGLAFAIAGYLYPLWMKDLTRIIPGWKNIYVSMVYPLLVPFVAVSNAQIPEIGPWSLLVMCMIFAESYLYQVLLDTKDVDSDRQEHLRTFAVLFGKQSVLHVVSLLNILYGCAVLLYLQRIPVLPGFGYFVMGIVFTRQLTVILLLKGEQAGYFIAAGGLMAWIVPIIMVR